MFRKLMYCCMTALIVIVISSCNNAGETGNIKTIPVEVAPVELGSITKSISFTGDIEAEFGVNVFSKIPDRIEKYFVDAGDKVSKGSPIAKILSITAEQGVRQAEAALSAALAQKTNMTSEYARAKKLNMENAMSQQQFDGIQAQYEAVNAQVEQAKAALASARSHLADATITAPISGIIGKRFMEAGDMASPALPVASVVQMNNVKAVVEVTEADLGQLQTGQDAFITVRSYPGESFKGTLTKISPVLDPLTRMATVEILVPNPDKRLKPGMFADVTVVTGTITDKIVIPRYCVFEKNVLQKNGSDEKVIKEYYVYVATDSSRAVQRNLNVSYINHVSIAVDSGIALGEKLIIAGQNNLRQDALVSITQGEAE